MNDKVTCHRLSLDEDLDSWNQYAIYKYIYLLKLLFININLTLYTTYLHVELFVGMHLLQDA